MSALARRDFAESTDRISARNFEHLARFIYSYSGIKMPSSKMTMLEGRLRRRLRATGIDTFDGYCDYLFKGDGLESETVHLIDAVTTNKTDFFREPRHFDYMAERVLPELAAKGVRHIRAWSSACSTGAEPYTMAMVTQAFAERRNDTDYTIVATDLSTDVLQTARDGVYSQHLLEPTPPDLRRQYVMQAVDARRRQVRISPVLRAKVAFGRMNLMDDSYPVGEPFDIVFCRNVMIYFDKETQAKVLQRLCATLKPGGYLMIGHAESIAGVDLPVTTVANTIFRKH